MRRDAIHAQSTFVYETRPSQYDSLRQVIALWFVSSLYENMFYCKTVRHVSLIKFYLITSVCYFTSGLSLSLSIRLYSQRLVEDLLNKDSSGGMVQRRFYESISTNIPSIVYSFIYSHKGRENSEGHHTGRGNSLLSGFTLVDAGR